MIAEGVSVSSRPSPLLDAARATARETLRLGPVPLDADAVRLRRYVITDLAAALQGDRSRGVLIAVGAALHAALADFDLRAAGPWSASGKALPRALAAMDPPLAERFTRAFAALSAESNLDSVQALVGAVLFPYGGRLRECFRQGAPTAWRDVSCAPSTG
jgi:hypothetical protein